jgi:hypothetical protein
LRLSSGAGAEVTFTVVPKGTEIRIGIDRDSDTHLDRDELDACADPADPTSTPGSVTITGDPNRDNFVDLTDFRDFSGCLAGPGVNVALGCDCGFDFDRDGDVDMADHQALLSVYTGPEN